MNGLGAAKQYAPRWLLAAMLSLAGYSPPGSDAVTPAADGRLATLAYIGNTRVAGDAEAFLIALREKLASATVFADVGRSRRGEAARPDGAMRHYQRHAGASEYHSVWAGIIHELHTDQDVDDAGLRDSVADLTPWIASSGTALRPRILVLELADPAHLVHPEVPVALLPDVERGLADPELAADVADRRAGDRPPFRTSWNSCRWRRP